MVQANWRDLWTELGRTFGVLALIVLGLAHSPVYFVGAGGGDFAAYALPDGSLPFFCNQIPAGQSDAFSGSQCDTCRIANGAALPAMPVMAPVRHGSAVKNIRFGSGPVLVPERPAATAFARAPPLAA